MTLLIDADQVSSVLTMAACIEAMEAAFAEAGAGLAVSPPRQRFRVPRELEPGQQGYMGNVIAGAVPSRGVAALRYDSALVSEHVTPSGGRQRDYAHPSGRSYGFVILFSLETGEPLAILQDFTLSPMRVGATTAVALRRLARADARILGLFGTGNQARSNLEGACEVCRIERVRVFSPDPEHRETFAREMSERMAAEIEAVGSPRRVVAGADVVLCATRSAAPVFEGEWLEPGQTLATIVNSDAFSRRSEVDETAFLRSDPIVVNSRETARVNSQRELLDPIEAGRIGWDRVSELGELLVGTRPGRSSEDQIAYYKNNAGMGIQFAAAGAVVYEACRRRGLGHEIPTEWFGADVGAWLARGFRPSP